MSSLLFLPDGYSPDSNQLSRGEIEYPFEAVRVEGRTNQGSSSSSSFPRVQPELGTIVDLSVHRDSRSEDSMSRKEAGGEEFEMMGTISQR